MTSDSLPSRSSSAPESSASAESLDALAGATDPKTVRRPLRTRLLIGTPLLLGVLGVLGLDYAIEQAAAAPVVVTQPVGVGFGILALLAAVLAGWEVQRMLRLRGWMVPTRLTLAFIALLVLAGVAAGVGVSTGFASVAVVDFEAQLAAALQFHLLWAVTTIFPTWVALTIGLWSWILWSGTAAPEEHARRAQAAIGGTFVVTLLGVPFALAATLRFVPEAGLALVLLILLGSRIGDVGAYFVGRFLGRHKWIEAVSPKKTVEGFVGGLIFSLGVGLSLGVLFPSLWLVLPGVWLPIASLAVGLAAQLADLVASSLKRWAELKDSSRLIPEFGGVLDLVDGFLFSAPTLAALLALRALIEG